MKKKDIEQLGLLYEAIVSGNANDGAGGDDGESPFENLKYNPNNPVSDDAYWELLGILQGSEGTTEKPDDLADWYPGDPGEIPDKATYSSGVVSIDDFLSCFYRIYGVRKAIQPDDIYNLQFAIEKIGAEFNMILVLNTEEGTVELEDYINDSDDEYDNDDTDSSSPESNLEILNTPAGFEAYYKLKKMLESEGKVYVTSFPELFDNMYGAGNYEWYYPNIPKWQLSAFHVENIKAAVAKVAKDFDMKLALDMSKQIIYVTGNYTHYESPFKEAEFKNDDALDRIYREFRVHGEMSINNFLTYFYKVFELSNYKIPKDKHYKQNVQTAVNKISDEFHEGGYRKLREDMTFSINFENNTISAVIDEDDSYDDEYGTS